MDWIVHLSQNYPGAIFIAALIPFGTVVAATCEALTRGGRR